MKKIRYYYFELWLVLKGQRKSIDTFCFPNKKERRRFRTAVKFELLAGFLAGTLRREDDEIPVVQFEYFTSREFQRLVFTPESIAQKLLNEASSKVYYPIDGKTMPLFIFFSAQCVFEWKGVKKEVGFFNFKTKVHRHNWCAQVEMEMERYREKHDVDPSVKESSPEIVFFDSVSFDGQLSLVPPKEIVKKIKDLFLQMI